MSVFSARICKGSSPHRGRLDVSWSAKSILVTLSPRAARLLAAAAVWERADTVAVVTALVVLWQCRRLIGALIAVACWAAIDMALLLVVWLLLPRDNSNIQKYTKQNKKEKQKLQKHKKWKTMHTKPTIEKNATEIKKTTTLTNTNTNKYYIYI